MTDSYLIFMAALAAGYTLTDIIFKLLFGVKLIIKNSEGVPIKYRLKNGKLRRIGPGNREK